MGLFIKQTGPSLAFTMPNDKPIIVVGLGNVGDKYKGTRHNIGFCVIDRLSKELGCEFKLKTSLDAEIADAKYANSDIVLIKPTTMMNLSGRSVQKIMHFYKTSPDRLVVIHDELDLNFGDIRTKLGGGSAGHNGIKSISTCVGQDFHRIRIGINADRDPRFEASDFVLGRFTAEESSQLDKSVLKAAIKDTKQVIDSIK